MQSFFNDLDGFTIFASVIVIVLGFIAVLYTAGERPRSFGRRYAQYMGLVIVCLPIAWDAWCPDAGQPHIQTTGWLLPVRSYTYHSGKSTHTGLIACLDSCDDSTPRLALDEYAAYRFQNGRGAHVSITCLGRTENAEIGNHQTMIAHPVVEIDSVTGTRLFYRDTTRHWPRVIVLMSDFALGLVAMVICWALRGKTAEAENDGPGKPNELMDLGLGNR